MPRYKGTKILAADGSTIEVTAPPELHSARAMVLLQAQEAKLQVTPDHRIVKSNGGLAPWLRVNGFNCCLFRPMFDSG